MSEFLLECSNISKTYPGVKALDDVRFSLKRGEIHALIGENGAGKSTFIKILSGVEKPDKGAIIHLSGEKLDSLTPFQAIQKGVSVIYQDLSLLGNLSAGENIFLGHLLGKRSFWVNWKKLHRDAARCLAEISLDINPEVLIEQLPVGKQQLVAISRALLLDTAVLIMDEPTSALSGKEVEDLFQVMFKLKNQGISIIFISHKLDELFRACDRFTIFRDGCYMGSFCKSELTEKRLIQLMVGRDIEYFIHPKRDKSSEKPVLTVRNFTKRKNFSDISFDLYRGEILGFYGMIGAGRTELMQAVFGAEKTDSGSIRVNGEVVRITSPVKARELSISCVPEDRLNEGLFLLRSMHDNLIITSPFICKLRWRNHWKEQQLVREQVEQLRITPQLPELPVEKLSGGNKQKVVMGKWLAINPMIMIIDEPTNGIDIGAKTEIHNLLRRLSEEGVSIIIVSSDMNEIISIVDRLAIMRRGRISKILTGAEIDQKNIIQHAVTGLQETGNGNWITGFPDSFIQFGQYRMFSQLHGLPVQCLFVIVALLFSFTILKYTTPGRSIYAIGENRISAERFGIDISRVLLFAYFCQGLLQGLAAFVHTSIVGQSDPNAFIGFELEVIAAVVIGGAGINGGRGRVRNVVVGTLFIAVMNNGLTLGRIPVFWQKILLGITIIFSVTVDQLSSSLRAADASRIDVEQER
ncbi:putative ribose/galactose/methyl galactoside import ATP-binding protein [Saccostrea echinata]|uniref:putative ribose/galactose/methyl galactoside import ATP-binding protein n=1 Tax=Saccostrea echinata TaxID=191078 RepID=UPI002A7F60D7|nr:putative ribose/galactose/methyl galactoside import ATP-binding protein [Saccostrea echinata]